MTDRRMFDAVTASKEPKTGDLYAFYADGTYANGSAVKTLFPGKLYVSIAVRWTTRAQVLDVETGDATPAEAVQWCTKTMSDMANSQLTIYANTSTWPSVVAAFKAAGVTLPQWWAAKYDGVATRAAGEIAKQYLSTTGYDESVVAPNWPGVDTAPKPPTPAPVTPPAPPKPSAVPQWAQLQNTLAGVPEGVYEVYTSSAGWNNLTPFGTQYGENGVSWCVIFDWDVYSDTGLAAVVPKTDNVDTFMAWAQARGQWSAYPSVGAWVNFENGGHTEMVTGFDALYVYTKGGNTIATGAADNGQGNGVFSHKTVRTSSTVVGYFAPKYPDGVCPPTADPKDYRGGKAVTSYRFTPTASPNLWPAATKGKAGTEMVIVYPNKAEFTGTAVWPGEFLLLDNGTLKHISTGDDLTGLKAAGVGRTQISKAFYTVLGGK